VWCCCYWESDSKRDLQCGIRKTDEYAYKLQDIPHKRPLPSSRGESGKGHSFGDVLLNEVRGRAAAVCETWKEQTESVRRDSSLAALRTSRKFINHEAPLQTGFLHWLAKEPSSMSNGRVAVSQMWKGKPHALVDTRAVHPQPRNSVVDAWYQYCLPFVLLLYQLVCRAAMPAH
jgi:hypothetical protein